MKTEIDVEQMIKRCEELRVRLNEIRQRAGPKGAVDMLDTLVAGNADPDVQLLAGQMLMEAAPVMGRMKQIDPKCFDILTAQALLTVVDSMDRYKKSLH